MSIKKSKNEIQRDYEKRTGYAAQKKYNAINTKKMTFTFVKTTEADIIEHLEAQPNKAGYIKNLIRADIEKNK